MPQCEIHYSSIFSGNKELYTFLSKGVLPILEKTAKLSDLNFSE